MKPFPIPDALVRREALDPTRSFIVQAPAGSGKTGLLIQRYLRLLACVESPEDVLAITFTRKAAGEMRERVLEALLAARTKPEPADAHARGTWCLARAVAEQAARRGWELAEQPSRLRIMTIDSLCGWLARGLPLGSGLAGDRRITDDPGPIYREAAALTLELVEEDEALGEPVATLLGHLDNDTGRFRSLLVEMLARRDQWLRFTASDGADGLAWRGLLEDALARDCAARLAALAADHSAALWGEVVAVCGYAGRELARTDPEAPGSSCAGLDSNTGPYDAGLASWRGVKAVLQTGSGTWRKRFTRREGFAPGERQSAEIKARAAALCDALDSVPGLGARLTGIAIVPDPAYTDEQWVVLDALLEVLRISAGLLKVVLAERRELDYIEVAAAARDALGAEEAPSELALALDYRVRHMLVDEFQDTSHAQFELFTRLSVGWSPGDGRTMFLVGDPMQSIYRFREADVGLYQYARANGIGHVQLEPLALSANFRSAAPVVSWINRVFPDLFAREDDAASGAVAYGPCSAVRGLGEGPAGVEMHGVALRDSRAEAEVVVELARQAIGQGPGASVAVLVRARTHLSEILPSLRAAGIAFRGVDVEPLSQVPAVRDLLALATAAMQPLDRIAWLSLLRAPVCGLRLADLHALVDGAPDLAVPAMIEDPERLARLDGEARERVERVGAVLLSLLAGSARDDFARRIEGAWQALRGPACVEADDLRGAERFLSLLREIGDDALALRPANLRRRAAELFARPDPGEVPVEVMTIHKAKGLEFDTVIIPGLERPPRAGQRHLLAWTRRASGPDAADLLLAPIPAADGTDPPLYEFVRQVDREKSAHETARLLYVAATRARELLHLVVGLERDDDSGEIRPPHPASLLSLLTPAVGGELEALSLHGAPRESGWPAGEGLGSRARLRRLPARWQAPAPEAPVSTAAGPLAPEAEQALDSVEFDWAGRLARHVGTVVHAMFRTMSREGAGAWTHGRLREHREAWGSQLRALGVGREDLDTGIERVERALGRAIEDPKAHWLLDPEHAEAVSELAVSGIVSGQVVRAVVDRTFVDPSGTRWIVDYKIGRHEGGSAAEFLDREQQRYREQLERYATLLAPMHSGPMRLALYFPVSGGWREWSPARDVRWP